MKMIPRLRRLPDADALRRWRVKGLASCFLGQAMFTKADALNQAIPVLLVFKTSDAARPQGMTPNTRTPERCWERHNHHANSRGDRLQASAGRIYPVPGPPGSVLADPRH